MSKRWTVTLNNNGYVASWADVRGGGYPTATAVHEKKATFLANAKGDMSAINLGAPYNSNYYHDYAGFSLPECPDVRTMFSVLDTTQGGGFLLGNDDKRSPSHVAYIVNNGKLRGLYRVPDP